MPIGRFVLYLSAAMVALHARIVPVASLRRGVAAWSTARGIAASPPDRLLVSTFGNGWAGTASGGSRRLMTTPPVDSIQNTGDSTQATGAKTKREKSLAHLASSPERLANALDMTPEQVDEAVRARNAASAALHERLVAFEKENMGCMTPGEIGKVKHRMICRHRYTHMRQPFVCRKCWTYLPICVCPLFERAEEAEAHEGSDAAMERSKAPLPKGVERLVVWTHHEEWGRPANTGSLLPLTLDRTDMLMKGLDDHDAMLDELLGRDDLTPIVLWPGKGEERDNATTTVSDLLGRFVESNNDANGSINTTGGILLISIEGTWNNARKMVNKLPPSVLRLDLGEEIAASFSSPDANGGIFHKSTAALPAPKSSSPSLLAPLRRQGKGSHGHAENVSTLEATIVALVALGLKNEEAERILRIARTKVDRIRQYTGKVHSRG